MPFIKHLKSGLKCKYLRKSEVTLTISNLLQVNTPNRTLLKSAVLLKWVPLMQHCSNQQFTSSEYPFDIILMIRSFLYVSTSKRTLLKLPDHFKWVNLREHFIISVCFRLFTVFGENTHKKQQLTSSVYPLETTSDMSSLLQVNTHQEITDISNLLRQNFSTACLIGPWTSKLHNYTGPIVLYFKIQQGNK